MFKQPQIHNTRERSMAKKQNSSSPFHWQGQPSIFTKEVGRKAHDFNGVNKQRSTMQSRIEPRPLWLASDSLYMQQPKIERKPRG